MRGGFGHAHGAKGSQVLASLAGEALVGELCGLGSSLLHIVGLVAAGGHVASLSQDQISLWRCMSVGQPVSVVKDRSMNRTRFVGWAV
jgi:hypothetical protein